MFIKRATIRPVMERMLDSWSLYHISLMMLLLLLSATGGGVVWLWSGNRRLSTLFRTGLALGCPGAFLILKVKRQSIVKGKRR